LRGKRKYPFSLKWKNNICSLGAGDVLRFMDFRYKIWASIYTTNLIERVFWEFLKAYKHNEYISNRKVFVSG